MSWTWLRWSLETAPFVAIFPFDTSAWPTRLVPGQLRSCHSVNGSLMKRAAQALHDLIRPEVRLAETGHRADFRGAGLRVVVVADEHHLEVGVSLAEVLHHRNALGLVESVRQLTVE